MISFLRRWRPQPKMVPLTIITGFLGSGKTTVLAKLLQNRGMRDTAVIVNEFGEVGLDHLLVEHVKEKVVLIGSGCVCCTVRGDLLTTIEDLFARQRRGQIPRFSRIVVETTGLADPAPLVHALMAGSSAATRVSLDSVCATVDAVNGLATLKAHPESVKQVAVSDLLLVTKTDLTDNDSTRELEQELGSINLRAEQLHVVDGDVAPDMLFAHRFDATPRARELERWLDDVVDDKPHAERGGINTFTIVRDEPLSLGTFELFRKSLVDYSAPDFLRIKGMINIAGLKGPVIVHGVQHVFHPDRQLKRWPSDDHRTRIVFITRGIEKAGIEFMLRGFERTADFTLRQMMRG